jgi:hypothetical protein
MTANIGSAEQSSGGQVGAGHADRSETEQEVSAKTSSTRHLYVVHSAEAPRNPPAMERPPPPARQKKSRGMIDRSVQAQIGRMLRDGFSDIAQEPVPPRFVRLLEALDAKEKKP